jgi:hypothetical protein
VLLTISRDSTAAGEDSHRSHSSLYEGQHPSYAMLLLRKSTIDNLKADIRCETCDLS